MCWELCQVPGNLRCVRSYETVKCPKTLQSSIGGTQLHRLFQRMQQMLRNRIAKAFTGGGAPISVRDFKYFYLNGAKTLRRQGAKDEAGEVNSDPGCKG